MIVARRKLAVAGLMAVWSGAGAPDPSVVPAVLTDDKIVITGGKERDAVMSLVHGQNVSDACPDGAAIAGRGTHTITNVSPPSACQVTVFSKPHRVIEVTPPWTNGSDAVPVTLAGALPKVELAVFVATNDPSADSVAHADVAKARRLFRRNRVGLSLKESNFVSAGALTAAQIAVIGDKGCEKADAIVQNFRPYDRSRINIFFVEKIGIADWRGYNCVDTMTGNSSPKPNIVFVSLGSRTPATLAHELGHALGLQGPTGHTGPPGMWGVDKAMTGFTSTNIMWTGLNADEGAQQKHLSLGQAYRMNATNESWLHATGAAVSGIVLPSRACHANSWLDKTPCPPLAFDVP
jgi:hypothetical protein